MYMPVVLFRCIDSILHYQDSCHGMNALHFAASTGHLEMVKYLLPLYGEKKFNVDNNGDTCLDLAIKAKHKKVVDYLLQEAGFADQG